MELGSREWILDKYYHGKLRGESFGEIAADIIDTILRGTRPRNRYGMKKPLNAHLTIQIDVRMV